MDQAVLLALQFSALIVLLVSLVALKRSISVWRSLRDKDGGALAAIVVGVIFAFLVAQSLSVINVLFVLTSEHDFHPAVRLVQQSILIVGGLWAARQLSRLG